MYLRDIWPGEREVAETIEQAVQSDMFRKSYGEVFEGDERWNSLAGADGRSVRVGGGLDVRAAAAVLPGHAAPSPSRCETSRARACWPSWATA